MSKTLLENPDQFSAVLYEKMQLVHPGVAELDLREFCYALENINPVMGWHKVNLATMVTLEEQLNDQQYYLSIQIKPKKDGRWVMDEKIIELTRMLFVGLVTNIYPLEWINKTFYFDLRGFYFLHRTRYSSDKFLENLGGKPYRVFEPKQKLFEKEQAVGYKAFKAANAEVDACFIELMQKLVDLKGVPILIGIAGQTAAGKTEIVARLHGAFTQNRKKITPFEMDNFLTDRDYREEHGIDSLGKAALHYELLVQCLADVLKGRQINTPRYDFITGNSSHTLQGKLKSDCRPIEIEPADIIFMEGNFPFLLPEIAKLVEIKVVYLTADAVRLQRKWKRDMDYRKKYELHYFLNRYFREQYLMAEQVYIPQIEACDLLVDTTNASIWATPAIQRLIGKTPEMIRPEIGVMKLYTRSRDPEVTFPVRWILHTNGKNHAIIQID